MTMQACGCGSNRGIPPAWACSSNQALFCQGYGQGGFPYPPPSDTFHHAFLGTDESNTKGKGKGYVHDQDGFHYPPQSDTFHHAFLGMDESNTKGKGKGKGMNESDPKGKGKGKGKSQRAVPCASQLCRDGPGTARQECWPFFLSSLLAFLYEEKGLVPPDSRGCLFIHADSEDNRIKRILRGIVEKPIIDIHLNFHTRKSDETCLHGPKCLAHMLEACHRVHTEEDETEMLETMEKPLGEVVLTMFRIGSRTGPECRHVPYCRSHMEGRCRFSHSATSEHAMRELCRDANHQMGDLFSLNPRDPTLRRIMSAMMPP